MASQYGRKTQLVRVPTICRYIGVYTILQDNRQQWERRDHLAVGVVVQFQRVLGTPGVRKKKVGKRGKEEK